MADSGASEAKRRKEDCETLTKTIVKHFKGLTSDSKAVMGMLDTSIPQQPLLKIDGYGTVGLPINKHVVPELEKYMEQAPYGMGEETFMDRSVRDTLQIGPDQFKLYCKEFNDTVCGRVVDRVKNQLGLAGMKVWAKPYKLLLYKPGGHFKSHRDTEKSAGMFGTLIVQLPSVFTGGDLVVRHAGQEVVVKMDQEGSSRYCVVAAHYSDCEHEVTKVETGYRLVLVYNLCWEGTGQQPSAKRLVDMASSLLVLLAEYLENTEDMKRVCWGLEHLYSDSSLVEGGSAALKGADRKLVDAILVNNQVLAKEDQFELFLAKATRVDHQSGECVAGPGYSKWPFGKKCPGDCFDYLECDASECELSKFVAPSGGDLDMFDENFHPEEEVFGYGYDKFWGEGEGECSGPSGNEGATRDMWYNKWVLVMWRKDDGLVIKFNAGLKSGLQHILNTCLEGDMVQARAEVEEVLGRSIEKQTYRWKNMGNGFLTALDLALAIDDVDLCNKILNKFLEADLKISDPDVLAKFQALGIKYSWPLLQSTLVQLLDKAGSLTYQFGGFAKLFTSIELVLCDQLLLKMAEKIRGPDVGYYSLKTMTEQLPSVVDLILCFPLDLNRLGKQLASLPCMSSLEMLADLSTILATKPSGMPVLAAVEEMFLSIASKKADKLSAHIYAVQKAGKVMIQLGRSSNLQLLSDLILAQPDHQTMLCGMLGKVSASTGPLPPVLLDLVRSRITHISPMVAGGPPQFNWKQTKAVVPDHPKVDKFFKMDQEQFIYSGCFRGLKQAKVWVARHKNDEGTFAHFTAGQVGDKVYVEIIKKKEGFTPLETEYKVMREELNRLTGCISPSPQSEMLPSSSSTTYKTI